MRWKNYEKKNLTKKVIHYKEKMMKSYWLRNHKWVNLVFLIFYSQSLFSQNSSQYQLPVVTPVSPDAASIGKTIDVPVSLYNGVASIDIPFYTISYKGAQVPIGISYTATGIKVEEIASSVGMGWSLNAGGAISRIVRGIPDELSNGYISGQKNVYKLETGQFNETQRKDIVKKIASSQIDGEPDIFTLSLPGYSCKFFFDEDGNTHTIPESRTKITPGAIGGVGFRYWTVVTSDGMRYELGATDPSELSGGIEKTRNLNSCQQLFDEIYNTWYLTKITPLLGEPITFEYDSYNLTMTSKPSQTSMILMGVEAGTGVGCVSNTVDNCISSTTIFSKRLKKIVFNNGEVVFLEGASRLDVSGGKKTDEVIVSNKQGVTIKKIIFYHSYRTSFGGGTAENKRLFLDSLRLFSPTICNDQGCEENPQLYKFAYNGADLPERSSNSQDYWGYYNGRNNGQYLIPKEHVTYNGNTTILPGADRLPDEQSTMAGILEKVTYPTGGWLQLHYELNDVQSGVPYSKTIQRTYSYTFPVPPPEDDFGGIFVIESCAGQARILHGVATGVMQPGDPSNPSDNKQQWRLFKWNPATNDFSLQIGAFGSLTENNTNDQYLVLEPGMYKVVMYKNGNLPGQGSGQGAPDYPATIDLDWTNEIDCYKRPVGGLRVKETWLFDAVRPNDTLITTYNYNTFNDPSKSSGFLANFPSYQYWVKDEVATAYEIEDGELDIYIDKCILYRRSSMSNQPLSTTGSSTVGYANVTTSSKRNGKSLGKTQNTFVTPNQIPDDYEGTFPFAPINSYEWKRGVLTRQAIFKSNSDFTGYDTVQVQENTFISIGEFNYRGFKAGVDEGDLDVALGFIVNVSVPKERFFSIVSGFNFLSSTVSRTYDQKVAGNYIQSEQSSLVSGYNFKPSMTTVKNSKGEYLYNKVLYPGDYNLNVVQGKFAQGIKDIKLSNQVDLPIEAYSVRKAADQSEWVESGQLIQYNAKGLPDSVFSLRLPSPIQLSSFTPSYIDVNGVFKKDYRYEAVAVFRYDENGSLIERYKVDDLHTRYLWGYKSEYPIAECVNCNDTFAYTSFETNAVGNWIIPSSNVDAGGVTGSNYYTLANGTLSFSGLQSANKYILSYWTTNANAYSISGTSGAPRKGRSVTIGSQTWTYFEHSIQQVTSVQITGTGGIDEVRLYPSRAMLSTFTYALLLGLSSKCDLNSSISYYFYDEFGRLKLIKDQDNNTVKTFEYKFQSQQ